MPPAGSYIPHGSWVASREAIDLELQRHCPVLAFTGGSPRCSCGWEAPIPADPAKADFARDWRSHFLDALRGGSG